MLRGLPAVALGFLLVQSNAAWAGTYLSTEKITPAGDLGEFVVQLAYLRGYGPPDGLTVSSSETTRHRDEFLARVEALRQKPMLTPTERADLGGYLIYLRAPRPGSTEYLDEAVKVLETTHREAPNEFAVAANLGTAYHLLANLGPAAHPLGGEVGLRMAERMLDKAVGLAPDAATKQAERLHLRLVQTRAEEMRQPARGFPGTPEPDQLFRVRFVGESGRWELATIAAREREKIPPDAIQQLQALLISLPDDGRLNWLLAELANASGELAGLRVAAQLYPDSSPELRKRKSLLRDAVAWRETLARSEHPPVEVLELVLAGAAATGETLDPAASASLRLEALSPPPRFTFDGAIDDGLTAVGTLAFADMNWKTWTVIAVGGGAVLALLFLQWREARRRRQLRQAGVRR